jgi:hypothetical protein
MTLTKMQDPSSLTSYNGSCKCGVIMQKIRDGINEETIQQLELCDHHTHYCICHINISPYIICKSQEHTCACDTHSSFVTCFADEDNHECICWSLTAKKTCIAKEHDCGCCGKYWMKKQSKACAYTACHAKIHTCDYKKAGYDIPHNCIVHSRMHITCLKETLFSRNVYLPNELFGNIVEFL